MIAGIIQWYALRFSFPHRGLKYFFGILKLVGLQSKHFKKKTPTGAFFWCNNQEHIERQIFWYGYYESCETKWLLPYLSEQNVFCDIGANIGYYSVLAAHANPLNVVIAFEPSVINAKRLQENVSLNGIEKQVTLVPFAVGRNAGNATLFQSAIDNRGMTSLQPTENTVSSSEVSIVALDDFFRQQDVAKPEIIKMDIEGAEWQALQGMQNLLAHFKPMLLIELDDKLLIQNNSSANEIAAWLSHLGYDAFQINDNSLLEPLEIGDQPISMAVFIRKQ